MAGGFAILALLVGAAFVVCDKDDDGGGGGSGGVKFPDNFQGVWRFGTANLYLKIDGGTLLSAIGSTPDWTSNTTTKFVLSKIDIDNNKYTFDVYSGGNKIGTDNITATQTNNTLEITIGYIPLIPTGTYTKQ